MKCINCNKDFDRNKTVVNQCSVHSVNKWIITLYFKYFAISLVIVFIISFVINLILVFPFSMYISGILSLLPCIWAMLKVNKLIIKKVKSI